MKLFFACSIFVLFWSCANKITPVKKEQNTIPISNIDSSAIFGESIFNSKCGKCHDLKAPADYAFHEWEILMETMSKKAHLDSTQKANILAFGKANAKP